MRSIDFLVKNGVDINKSLELFGDIDTYNDTIGDFIVSAKDKISKLKNYMHERDMANYAIYVHSLKSDARYFGFTDLGEKAYEHELKSKEGNNYFVREDFATLEEMTNNAVNTLLSYMNEDDDMEGATTTPTAVEEVKEDVPTGVVYDNPTILVADDSSIIRSFVEKIFSDKYNVACLEDGRSVIDTLKVNKDNSNIVCLLLDLAMPNVDGFGVLEYMNDNDLLGKVPVSIISGDSTKSTINKAFTYNIVDMIEKPFTEGQIKLVVDKTLMVKEVI